MVGRGAIGQKQFTGLIDPESVELIEGWGLSVTDRIDNFEIGHDKVHFFERGDTQLEVGSGWKRRVERRGEGVGLIEIVGRFGA